MGLKLGLMDITGHSYKETYILLLLYMGLEMNNLPIQP